MEQPTSRLQYTSNNPNRQSPIGAMTNNKNQTQMAFYNPGATTSNNTTGRQ
jgi:hypothetical protein